MTLHRAATSIGKLLITSVGIGVLCAASTPSASTSTVSVLVSTSFSCKLIDECASSTTTTSSSGEAYHYPLSFHLLILLNFG